MKKPFVPLGCAIEANVKPEDRRTWDTRSYAGFSLGTSMQHHCCFCVYITTTRATRISDTIFQAPVYHQPGSLTGIPRHCGSPATCNGSRQYPGGQQDDRGINKVSNIFTKIAAEKSKVAKAKAQCNRVQATPSAHQTTYLPRVEAPLPRVADSSEADCRIIPRVANSPQEDCRIVEEVPTPSTSRPVAQAPATRS